MPKSRKKSQGPPTTGWVPHEPDPRQITFAEAVPFLEELPEEYDSVDLLPDYQDGVPKCVIESFSYLSRLQDYYETGEDKTQSADAGYAIAKMVYDKNRDYGTSLLTGAKVACNYGFPEENMYPDNEEFWNSDPDKYFDVSRWTYEVKESAAIHRKRAYASVGGGDWGAITPEELKQAIIQRKGVVVAIRGNGNFMQDGTGFVHAPIKIDGLWYHAIVLKGWKRFNDILHFKMANWWDPAKSGLFNGSAFGWLKFNEWQPHIWGGMTTIDALNTEFVTKILMAKLVRDPGNPEEVYAINNGFKSHIANGYSLREGAKLQYWSWKEGDEIPVGDSSIWPTLQLAGETVHSPGDAQ